MKTFINPALNPNGLMAALAAVYGIAQAVWNVYHGQPAVDPQVIIAAAGTWLNSVTHFMVTPHAAPRTRDGQPLKPEPPASPTA